jgi:hypothetical protein
MLSLAHSLSTTKTLYPAAAGGDAALGGQACRAAIPSGAHSAVFGQHALRDPEPGGEVSGGARYGCRVQEKT